MKMLKELTDDNFQKEVIEDGGIVLVDFYAQWCGPCKVLAKTVEELSNEMEGTAKICKADIEENNSAVKDLNINGVPFVALFKNGKVLNKHIGLRSKQDLQKDIEEAQDEG
jgi:thioredoxin 1